MSKKTDSEYIKEFCKTVLHYFLDKPEKIRVAAKETGLSYTTVEQAKIYSKGSVKTFLLLLCHGLDITPKQLPKYAKNFQKMVEDNRELDYFEDLVAEARKKYSLEELVVWFKVLIAKSKMEKELGLVKTKKRRKKK